MLWSYEECRVKCVGLHLCLELGVVEIFGEFSQKELVYKLKFCCCSMMMEDFSELWS